MKKIFVLFGVLIFCMTLGLKEAMAAPPATGVACTAPCISSFEIQDGQVTSTDIADGAVTDTKITGPISSSKIQKAANVIVVAKSGGDFTSIQAAIDSINPTATNPYLIKVMPGTYIENILMKSYIHLDGAGSSAITIQSAYEYNSVIYIGNVTEVLITGFTIIGGSNGPGIYITTSSFVTIIDNVVKNGYYGIYNNNASPTIKRNVIKGQYKGISCEPCSAFISDNMITDNINTGIVISGGSNPTIVHNVISGNYYDVYVGYPGDTSTPHISFNIYNTKGGPLNGVGAYNVKSDGTPW